MVITFLHKICLLQNYFTTEKVTMDFLLVQFDFTMSLITSDTVIIDFTLFSFIAELLLCHLYFSPFLGVKKRHFFVCFLPQNRTETTICCGQPLLFFA